MSYPKICKISNTQEDIFRDMSQFFYVSNHILDLPRYRLRYLNFSVYLALF